MTTALKSVCFVVAGLGLVTAGVCVWVMAVPAKLVVTGNIHVDWDGKDPPKIGIATAVFMILLGFGACFINLEKRFIIFVAALFVILVIAIAFMSLAIKDHQDWKNIGTVQKSLSSSLSNFGNSGFNRGSQYSSANKGYIIHEDSLKTVLTRLKILAAVGGIDMVTLLIGLIVFYMKRPKGSSRNVMQMERTL